jgi:hypothetical protein
MTFALGVLCGFLLGTFCAALGFAYAAPPWSDEETPEHEPDIW